MFSACCAKFSDFKISRRLVIIGWCSRYVHVIADTGIILVAFLALDKKDEEKVRRGSSPSGTETKCQDLKLEETKLENSFL